MYYRYLLTTITTISTVTAVAIPQNQGQGQNQVYGQRPGIHGQPQNDLYSTVPIVIPTHNGNEIPEQRYEQKQEQFKNDQSEQHPGEDSDHIGKDPVNQPSSTTLQPSQSGYLPRGPSGIPMGHGPVVVPSATNTPGTEQKFHIMARDEIKPGLKHEGPKFPLGHGPVVYPTATNAPEKRDGDDIQAWPSLNGIPLGPGPVVLHTKTSSVSTPTPMATSASGEQPHVQARDASKTKPSWPSLSGVPLGHGPAVVPGHEHGDKPHEHDGDGDSQA